MEIELVGGRAEPPARGAFCSSLLFCVPVFTGALFYAIEGAVASAKLAASLEINWEGEG
jgi:hypothetical protein